MFTFSKALITIFIIFYSIYSTPYSAFKYPILKDKLTPPSPAPPPFLELLYCLPQSMESKMMDRIWMS